MKKSFLIIKAGKSFESIIDKYGDFDEFTLNAFPQTPNNVVVYHAQSMPMFPDTNHLYGVVITGAHENTTDNEPWMIHLKKWIKSIYKKQLPVLGICFGHQIIAEALGGVVGFNANGGEFGVAEVVCNTADAFKLPDVFNVFASHYQSVVKLPQGAVSIAGNNIEPNHFVIYSDFIWGLQFHPEFNRFIMRIHQQKNKKVVDRESNQDFINAEAFGNQLLNQFYDRCVKFIEL